VSLVPVAEDEAAKERVNLWLAGETKQQQQQL
jgi:hypothetical protein